jgi:hypothetical protein
MRMLSSRWCLRMGVRRACIQTKPLFGLTRRRLHGRMVGARDAHVWHCSLNSSAIQARRCAGVSTPDRFGGGGRGDR